MRAGRFVNNLANNFSLLIRRLFEKVSVVSHEDILKRLRLDPGQRTLGQLLQERESAANEIERLRSEIQQLKSPAARSAPTGPGPKPSPKEISPPKAFRPGTLIRLTEVCELLGIGRSTVYKVAFLLVVWGIMLIFPLPLPGIAIAVFLLVASELCESTYLIWRRRSLLRQERLILVEVEL